MFHFQNFFKTPQSKIVLATGVVMILAFTRRPNFFQMAMAFLSVFLNAYVIDCLVTGSCTNVAWFYAIINVIAAYIVIVNANGKRFKLL